MKERLVLALKIALTLALFAILLHRVDGAALLDALGRIGGGAVAAAVGLTAVAVLVASWRWRRVLAHLGERVGMGPLLCDFLVGTTYNMILPTSVGGDVVRAFRCRSRLGDAMHAWASVVFERLLGLLSLALLGTIGILATATSAGNQLLVGSVAFTLVTLAALLWAELPLRVLARVGRLVSARLGDTLDGLAASFGGPLGRPAARLETFVWSLVYQGISLTVLLAASWSWLGSKTFAAVYFGVPVALVGAVLPVTFGGLGLRESLFVVVLAGYGVAAEHALALSLVWLGSSLLPALGGLVVMLAGRK